MDQFSPKGPPDGAFERFLSAAIATIITIIFSWRMVDKLNEDKVDTCHDYDDNRKRNGNAKFSSPSQLHHSALSRIPVLQQSSSTSSSLPSSTSSLYSRALLFAPLVPSTHSPSSSTSSSPSSSSSGRRQLPAVPLDSKLSDHKQQLLNEKMSSLKAKKSSNSTEYAGLHYKCTELKPIIRVPVDLPLCGDDEDECDEDFHSNVDHYESKIRNNDVTSIEEITSSKNSNLKGNHRGSPMNVDGDDWTQNETGFEGMSCLPIDGKITMACENVPRLEASIDSHSPDSPKARVKEGEENENVGFGMGEDRLSNTELVPEYCEISLPYTASERNTNSDSRCYSDDKNVIDGNKTGNNQLQGTPVVVKYDEEEDDEDDDVRDELREIESSFGNTEPYHVYMPERNNFRNVVVGAGKEEDDYEDEDNQYNPSHTQSDSELFDSSVDNEDSPYLDIVSATKKANPFLNVSWDSIPTQRHKGSGLDHFDDGDFVDYDRPFPFRRENSDKIRVYDRRSLTTDLDNDDDDTRLILPDDEDEFFLTSASSTPLSHSLSTSSSRPLCPSPLKHRGHYQHQPQHGSYDFDEDDDEDGDGIIEIDYYDIDNDDDLIDVDDDGYDVQPRELESDEELFCCSLLEPIMEEDSEDLSSTSTSSSDIDSNGRSPRVLRRLILRQYQRHQQKSEIEADLEGINEDSGFTGGLGVYSPPPRSPSPRHSNLSLLERTAFQPQLQSAPSSPSQSQSLPSRSKLPPPPPPPPQSSSSRVNQMWRPESRATDTIMSSLQPTTTRSNEGDNLNTLHLSPPTIHDYDSEQVVPDDYDMDRHHQPTQWSSAPCPSTVTPDSHNNTNTNNNTSNTDFDRSLLDQYKIVSDEQHLDHLRHHGSSVDPSSSLPLLPPAAHTRLSRSTGDIDLEVYTYPDLNHDSNLESSPYTCFDEDATTDNSRLSTSPSQSSSPLQQSRVAAATTTETEAVSRTQPGEREVGGGICSGHSGSTPVTRSEGASHVVCSQSSQPDLSTQVNEQDSGCGNSGRSDSDSKNGADVIHEKDTIINTTDNIEVDSFKQTFSTRVEVEDNNCSNSESDESVQTVVVRQLSSDSSSGGFGGDSSSSGTNNNSPSHSSAEVPISIRTSPSKTQRPLSDSLVYNAKKFLTADAGYPRDRVVSDGGGVPFGEEEGVQGEPTIGVDENLVLPSYFGGESYRNNNNNSDLRAYQSYHNLADFGNTQSVFPNTFPGRLPNIADVAYNDELYEGSEEDSGDSDSSCDINGEEQGYKSVRKHTNDPASTVQTSGRLNVTVTPPASEVGQIQSFSELDSSQNVTKPQTGQPETSQITSVGTAPSLEQIDEDGGVVDCYDIPEKTGSVYAGVDDHKDLFVPLSASCAIRTTTEKCVVSGGSNQDSDIICSVDSTDKDTVDYSDRSTPRASVKTVVVNSNPSPGSKRTLVVSKMDNNNSSGRREYTFGKAGYVDDGHRSTGPLVGEEDEDEWGDTITETFVVPESREKLIQRTLQNVKDMLDQRNPSQIKSGNDEDVDFDDECQSTCTTTLIDVISHDAMGFHGDDDERSGYREAQDAVARTDDDLKRKMGFELGFDDCRVGDYNTESGWPIVRYIEKERAFVDEDGEDVMDYEQEEEEEEEIVLNQPGLDEYNKRGVMEVDDNDEDEVEDAREIVDRPQSQGFFYPQTETVYHQPHSQAQNKQWPDDPLEYCQTISQPEQNEYDKSGGRRGDENDEYHPSVHVENTNKENDTPYEQYVERMNIPYRVIENMPSTPPSSKDIPYMQWDEDDEPFKRRDRDNRSTQDEDSTTPYSQRPRRAQTSVLKYEDDKLDRDLPQTRTFPNDPECAQDMSSHVPLTQAQTPTRKRWVPRDKSAATTSTRNKKSSLHHPYAQSQPEDEDVSPTVQVPDSPVIHISPDRHFPQQLKDKPLDMVNEDIPKEECVDLEVGASVMPPSHNEYSSSSEHSDSRGKPDEGFDSFLRGVPDFKKGDEDGYEEFVRDISDMDDLAPVDEIGVIDDTSHLQPPVSDGILSGNLTSPNKKSNVFVFPKDENKVSGSKTHSSPSYAYGDQTTRVDEEGTTKEKGQQSEPTGENVEEVPRFTGGARRSSAYSLYNESTGNVLNASFDESEMSGFAMEKYGAEPGLSRRGSTEALSRSRSREGNTDSPRSRSGDLSLDSPCRDQEKAASSISPSSNLFHSARNTGVSTEPSLDVVIEASNMSPQLSPVTHTSASVVNAELKTHPIPKGMSPGSDKMTPPSIGSPTRSQRIIAGSSFVPSFDEDSEPAPIQKSETETPIVNIQPTMPFMQPVVVELSNSQIDVLPIFSPDTPQQTRFDKSPSSIIPVWPPNNDAVEVIDGPTIKPISSKPLRSLCRVGGEQEHKSVSSDTDDDEDDEEDNDSEEEESEEEESEEEEENEKEESKIVNENEKITHKPPIFPVKDTPVKVDEFRAFSMPTSNLAPTMAHMRNISYSLESTDDVFPQDTSSASAVTSPHMSSDSASALEVPSSTTANSTPCSRHSSLSPSSSIITTRLLSPSSPASMKGTPWAHAQFVQSVPKKPKSLKEIKKKYKPYKSVLTQDSTTVTSSSSPRPAPFVPPEHMLTPSRLKILYSRNKFLSEQNLQSETISGEFKAHKDSLLSTPAPGKERRYAPNTQSLSKTSRYNSQEQLQRLKAMINSKPTRRSESALHECLHDDCILSEHGRREIIDKTLSIDNMHADIFQNLRRLASDGDAGAYEDAFFPETSSDLIDLTFPMQDTHSLDRPASMSELRHASNYSTISGSGMDINTTPSRHSTGKSRFAGHRQYKKSKSLCTLETDLDDEVIFANSPTEDGMKRVPSVHELRISKSLQKLNVPDWYSKSSLSKSGSCLLKYGSSSTMSSFQFSPSLISSPCTTPSSSTNVVIKTRVQAPTSARNMRSPRFPTSKSAPTTPSYPDQDKSNVTVKLPSDKFRSQEKAKNLMPIPIVPFDRIRAMFEKKTAADGKKPSDNTTSPKNDVSSPPTSPTSSSTIQQSFKSRQQSQPPNSLSINGFGEIEEEDEEDMVVPRIIVSPTEPHVKSILKKPTQEKRFPDIQENPEPVGESEIVRPIATRPAESTPTTVSSKPPPIPTSAVPEKPQKQQKETRVKLNTDIAQPVENKPRSPVRSPVKFMDESFSSDDGKNEKKSSSPKDGGPVAKPRGFKFFRSLRSSLSSSNEDVKEHKGRKSPVSPSGQMSPSKPQSQSPNTSYDSSGFPASPARKVELPGAAPPASSSAPDIGPNNDTLPTPKSEGSNIRLEEAPKVIQPPPPHSWKPSSDPANDSSSNWPTKETSIDDIIEENIAPPEIIKPVNNVPVLAPTTPTVEPKPEKKRWFPKPKGFRQAKTKEATEPKSPVNIESPPPDLTSKTPNDFEVSEMAYEPRRLRSSRSSDPNDSIVSDRSLDSRSSRPDSNRFGPNSRPSDFSIPQRKSSVDSNKSFTRDLDRVSDRALAGELDRGFGRGRDLDRRPPQNDISRRDRGNRPVDLDHRSPVSPDFDRGDPIRGSERRERPKDFDRREPARYSDRPKLSDRREPPRDVDSRIHPRDNENRRSSDLDRSSINNSRDFINRDGNSARPFARITDGNVEDRPRAPGKWQPKPRGNRSSVSPGRQDNLVNSNGAPSTYRFPVEGSAFSSSKPNTSSGLNTPPTTSKVNHDVTPSSPGANSDKSVRETTV